MDPARIATDDDLEEALSEPYPEDVAFARQLRGDVLVLGAGGKMGPSLVARIARAVGEAGAAVKVFAASRFQGGEARRRIESSGAAAIACDLLDDAAVLALPECANVVYMAGMKFGATGNEPLTWAMNAYLPGRVAERFRPRSRIAAFSTGNVYPLLDPAAGGAKETTPPAPAGEYAQSCLGRERVLEHFSRRYSTPMAILRLNYAVEARYGVLLDIALKVHRGEPVPLSMPHVNVIWQGDANSMAFRALALAAVPPRVLNIAGPEVLSVRRLAEELGARFGREPRLEGEERGPSLLSDGSLARELLGPPRVPVDQVIDLVAKWVERGGATLGKPTKFEVRDGKF